MWKALGWLVSVAIAAAAGMLVAFALAFALAAALLHVAFYVAIGFIVIGLLALGRGSGGGYRMSLEDAGAPEEAAHDAAELEREMHTIRTEGALESVRRYRTARLSFASSTWIGAGAALLLACVLFGT
ncbi:hypothetical protein FE782_29910 [Paenibacillus antri]|uniref:Uncharacterized protein n=1 Tax=Paenibacillus antri TaxID=2582848 RepID=A0A5R9G327_9BACL|nr:hypothetical protein [Paenibacillus antri]TLS48530.1 hypothetical protein FE782_29910 [Paenibacillus antri]